MQNSISCLYIPCAVAVVSFATDYGSFVSIGGDLIDFGFECEYLVTYLIDID